AGHVGPCRLYRRLAGGHATGRQLFPRRPAAQCGASLPTGYRLAPARPGRGRRSLMQWETVIGLEVHVQLNTASKIFSGSSTQVGAEPNSQASLVDLAMPGALPVVNQEAIHNANKFRMAINPEINRTTVFERKNYFYP